MRLHEVGWAVAAAARDSEGVVSRAALQAAGVSDGGLARAVADGLVHRVGRGVYGTAPLPAWPEHVLRDGVLSPDFLVHARVRVLEAGAGAVLSCRSSALLWGMEVLVEPTEVELRVPHHRNVPGARRARHLQGVDAVLTGVMRRPIPTLSAVDTVLSCAEELPLVEAVAIADSALRQSLVTLGALRAAASALPEHKQRAAVVRVLALVDRRAESVLESALRVRLVQAGAVGLEPQVVVRTRRRRVLRVDLAFPAARLAVETDGRRWHTDRAKDQRTDNGLAAAGWRVLRYGWRDVVHDWETTVVEVLEALAAGPPTLCA